MAVFPVQAGISLHQAPHLIERGLSPAVAATIVSSFSLVSAVAGLGFGLFARRIGVRASLALAALFLGASAVLMLAIATPLQGYLAACFFGAGIGGMLTVLPLAWADYFGRQSFGAIRGVALTVQVTAQASGPLLSGVLRDLTGDYSRLAPLLCRPILPRRAAGLARSTASAPVQGAHRAPQITPASDKSRKRIGVQAEQTAEHLRRVRPQRGAGMPELGGRLREPRHRRRKDQRPGPRIDHPKQVLARPILRILEDVGDAVDGTAGDLAGLASGENLLHRQAADPARHDAVDLVSARHAGLAGGEFRHGRELRLAHDPGEALEHLVAGAGDRHPLARCRPIVTVRRRVDGVGAHALAHEPGLGIGGRKLVEQPEHRFIERDVDELPRPVRSLTLSASTTPNAPQIPEM